jgi:hypothetical protein
MLADLVISTTIVHAQALYVITDGEGSPTSADEFSALSRGE